MRTTHQTLRTGFRLLCAAVLVLAAMQVFGIRQANSEETTPAQTAGEHGTVASASAPTSENVVAELEQRVAALNARARELDEQEARLKEREKDLEKKLKEMEHLRAAVTGELDGQKKENEEKVLKTVAVFESMTPKSAAAVIETLDDWLAVEVLKRMDTKRVAKILNVTEKTRTAKLSELLTGFYRPEADRKVSSLVSSAAAVSPGAGQAAKAGAPQTTPVVDSQKKGGER